MPTEGVFFFFLANAIGRHPPRCGHPTMFHVQVIEQLGPILWIIYQSLTVVDHCQAHITCHTPIMKVAKIKYFSTGHNQFTRVESPDKWAILILSSWAHLMQIRNWHTCD